jgi:hypothetical protein
MSQNPVPTKHIAHAIQDLYALIERTNEQITLHQAAELPNHLTISSYYKQKQAFTTQLIQLFAHLNLDIEISPKVAK